MAKLKKYIAIVIGITILLIMILVWLQFKQKEQEIQENNEDQLIQSMIRTTDINNFNTVDKCIQNFLVEIELKDSKIALSLLDEEYIEDNKINEDNVWNYLPEYMNKESYQTKEMYESTKEAYTLYLVKGRMNQSNVFFKVGIDATNRAFSITPITQKIYEEKTIENLDKVIDKKVYNVVVYQKLEEEEIAKLYYDDFLKTILYDLEEAYQMLDPVYRERRFENKKAFEDLIREKQEFFALTYQVETVNSGDYEEYAEYYAFKEEHEDLGAKSYLKLEYDEYVQYVCADIYENYYIFNVKEPGNYSVIYDKHTVDIPEFTKKYKAASNQIKMGMNIEKFFDAINTEDFSYAYKVLAKSFQDNYYPKQEMFENEIKQKLFYHNNVEYNNYTEEGDILVYRITVKDRTNEENSRDMTVIMQLKEGTDFVMSFNIE